MTVGADGADARHDGGHVGDRPAAHEALEQADPLEDVELDAFDVLVPEDDRDAGVPLDPRRDGRT